MTIGTPIIVGPPDRLYQTVHPITGVVTTWDRMIESDLSFKRRSANYSIFSANGGINPFSGGAAPLDIRHFKFTYIHPYQPGESYTQQRDKLMAAVGHGMEQDFFVKVSDGSMRKGRGACNVSDMRETRDAMVLFQASIDFECVNPFLTDQYESGALRWDNALTWDVGHLIQTLTASATLTGGSYKLAWNGNTTATIGPHDTVATINFRLATATPAAIPFIATGTYNGVGSPFDTNPPTPVTLSAISPGVTPAIALTAVTVTGGTLALATVQSGSAATPNLWDFSPNLKTLNVSPFNWTITSPGNVSDFEPIITVTGPINAPYLIFNLSLPGRLYGYLGFTVNESLAAGQQHSFDIGAMSFRRIVGGATYSAWPAIAWPEGQADLFRFDPGPNIVSILQGGAPTTTATAYVKTLGHYL